VPARAPPHLHRDGVLGRVLALLLQLPALRVRFRVNGLQMLHQGRGRIALAELDRRSFEILRLQAERAQGLMLIPGRVVLGRGLVLERPPPCTVLGPRGLLNAPLSDTPCNVQHTRGGPRALLGCQEAGSRTMQQGRARRDSMAQARTSQARWRSQAMVPW